MFDGVAVIMASYRVTVLVPVVVDGAAVIMGSYPFMVRLLYLSRMLPY